MITERCSCGATITVDASQVPYGSAANERGAITEWRTEHRHGWPPDTRGCPESDREPERAPKSDAEGADRRSEPQTAATQCPEPGCGRWVPCRRHGPTVTTEGDQR